MKIFWSWQNDYAPKVNRHFIREALAEAVVRVGNELGLEDAERPHLDHDTKNVPGMVDIAKTILDKISESAVFVADLTPIARTDTRKEVPNPNVLIELGWALSELGESRIIPILNTASGCTPDDLPFDIRHRRAMTYTLAESADKSTRAKVFSRLVDDLTQALSTNLRGYSEDQAAATEFPSVRAKDGDSSLWATASDVLTWHDSRSGNSQHASFPASARAYLRVIPSGWKTRIPAVADVADLRDAEMVKAVAYGSSSGDFGPCEQGFLTVWFTRMNPSGEHEGRNVVMWFEETGEYWVAHGTILRSDEAGKEVLSVHAIISAWDAALRAAMKALDKLGALPARKVEAGLVGIRGARWPKIYVGEFVARKDSVMTMRQQHGWDEAAQREFLTEAYNRIRDNFALPRADGGDVDRLLSGR